ncbi:MAG: hypothetical protein ACRDD2_00035 [Sarcina sp.]
MEFMELLGLIENKKIAEKVKRNKEIGLIGDFEILLSTDKKLVLKDSLGITIYQYLLHSERVDEITLYKSELDFMSDGLR